MFDIFKDCSESELENIYLDVIKSEEEGLRPKSLDTYSNQIKSICRFEMLSQATKLTTELLYKEIAKRYFEGKK